MPCPCETRTSTWRSFATISSGLYRFLAIAVLLDVKDIPQVGPLQWGRITATGQACATSSPPSRSVLRLLYPAEHIGSAFKGGVNACERQLINEVLGTLVTEFVPNFGREGATPIQLGPNASLFGRVQAVKHIRHSCAPRSHDAQSDNRHPNGRSVVIRADERRRVKAVRQSKRHPKRRLGRAGPRRSGHYLTEGIIMRLIDGNGECNFWTTDVDGA